MVDSQEGFPCLGNADDFVDYSVAPDPQEAELMCDGCSIFRECDDFARLAEKPAWGVWAGRVWKNRKPTIYRPKNR